MAGQFDLGKDQFCIVSGSALVSGLGATSILTFSQMRDRLGVPQLVEPSAALAAGQATLDSMSRMLIFSSRSAGVEPGSWTIALTFARDAGGQDNTAVLTTGYVIPLQSSTGSTVGVFENPLPETFMRGEGFATPAITDDLRLRIVVTPDEDTTDTIVNVAVILVPSLHKGFNTNKGVRINASDGRYN